MSDSISRPVYTRIQYKSLPEYFYEKLRVFFIYFQFDLVLNLSKKEFENNLNTAPRKMANASTLQQKHTPLPDLY